MEIIYQYLTKLRSKIKGLYFYIQQLSGIHIQIYFMLLCIYMMVILHLTW